MSYHECTYTCTQVWQTNIHKLKNEKNYSIGSGVQKRKLTCFVHHQCYWAMTAASYVHMGGRRERVTKLYSNH